MPGVYSNNPAEGPLPDLRAQQREAFIADLRQTWDGDPDATMRIQHGVAQFDVATDANATPIDWLHAGLPMDGDPEELDSASLSRGNKIILVGTLVTMAATGMAHATEERSAKTQPEVQTSSVQLALQSQSVEKALHEAVQGDAGNNARSKSSVLTASGDDPELKRVITNAVDLARVQSVIQRSRYYPEESASILSAIDDPTKRTVAETTVYTLAVDDMVKQSMYSPKDNKQSVSEARRQVNEQQIPEGAESIRDHAMDALDRVAASDSISELSASPMEVTDRLRAWAATEELASPARRVEVRRMVESLIVADALQDLYDGTKTGKDLVALAAEITNDTMKGVLMQYSKETATSEARGYSAWLREKVLEEKHTDLEPSDGPLALAVKIAQYVRTQSTQKTEDARNVAEASLSESFGARTGLRPEPSAPEITQEADPYELIDLKYMPSQRVPNSMADLANRKLGMRELMPPDLLQFGEVSVDGKLSLAFEDGVNDRVRQQFAQAFEMNRPLLEAAFAGGNLVSMRFVLEEDFNPYYLPASREIIMVLSGRGILTVDQLSSVMTHETTHALFRNYFFGIDVSEAEHKVLANACAGLQKAAYREIGNHLNQSPELLTNLRAALKPEHRHLADFLHQAAQNENMDQLLNPQIQNVQETTFANQCNNAGNSGEFYGRAVNAAGLGLEEFNGDLLYMRSSPALGKLVRSVDAFVREGSIYGKVINESGYVMTDSSDRPYLGHGEDNANETYASLMNAALNYPGGLQVKLASLGIREREAVKHMLSTQWDAAAARYPSLQPLFDRARVTLGIKK